jgi:hypothetical protein
MIFQFSPGLSQHIQRYSSDGHCNLFASCQHTASFLYRLVFLKLWFAAVGQVVCGWCQKKKCSKIVSDPEWMKNTPIHVCAKLAFVGWHSVESRQIRSFHNFLSYSHYFRKYFKLVSRKNVVMVTLTTIIMLLLFTCMHFRVWGILWRWFVCACISYEVVCDCWNLEKHCWRRRLPRSPRRTKSMGLKWGLCGGHKIDLVLPINQEIVHLEQCIWCFQTVAPACWKMWTLPSAI